MKPAQTGLTIVDYSKVSGKIQRFISNYLRSVGAKGLIIGLSGGLDSAVALHLCAKAVGPEKILGLVLPTTSTPDDDVSDAANQASGLGVECKVIAIDALMENYAKLMPKANDKVRGNLTARVRMSILYYFAGLRHSLVVGTSDKSEIMIGYFTKWGDGGSDLMPLADLYKTQVRQLARYLGVPRVIIEKQSSPRLWPGQLAEQEIGLSYNTIDPILYCLAEKKMKPRQVAKRLDLPLDSVRKVELMTKTNAHKRLMPPAARIT